MLAGGGSRVCQSKRGVLVNLLSRNNQVGNSSGNLNIIIHRWQTKFLSKFRKFLPATVIINTFSMH